MAIRDTALNIVIRAKDLARATIDKFRKSVQDVDEQADKAASGGLTRLAKAAAGAVAGFIGFQTIRSGLLSILDTGDRFEKLAIQLRAVMGSVEAGEQATNWIRDFTKNTPLQLEQVTEAFITLKNFGIDPQSGALQSIVDQNEKLGGGYERLIGITRAFGQAQAKQKLQGEEILQLVERGVPVYELLAEVTGKNGAELEKMQKNGQLTTDVIARLIEKMGEASTGAAAANMNTLTGIVSNLKDQWQEWLAQVAESGALESFKVELLSLKSELEKLAADGTLAKWAKSLSDAISGLLNGFVTSVKIIREYGSELALLAKVFATLKIAQSTAAVIAWGRAAVATAAQSATLGVALNGTAVAAGRVKTALGVLSAFAIGWEIGTYLREKFVTVEKLSNNLVAGLMKGWATLELAWESTKAIFTDNTIEQATANYKKKIDEITESNRILNEEADKAAAGLTKLGNEAAGAVGEILDLSHIVLDTVSTAAETAENRITDAFNTLKVEARAVEEGVSNVGRAAIDAFKDVVAAEQELGRESKIQARSIEQSFLSAFKKVGSELGKKELLQALHKAMTAGIISVEQYKKALKSAGTEAVALAQKLNLVEKEANEAGDGLERAGVKGKQGMQETTKAADDTGSALGLLITAIDAYTQRMAALSDAARAYWVDLVTGVKGAGTVVDDFQSKIDGAVERMKYLQDQAYKVFDATGFRRSLIDMGVAASQVKIEFYEQQIAIRDLQQAYADGRISAEAFTREAERVLETSSLLNDEDMEPLRRGIERARQEMERLGDQADDTLVRLQNELDRLNGDIEAVERRNYERDLAELQQQLDAARSQGNAEAIADLEESLRLAEQIYNIEKVNREEQARERAAREAERQARNASRENSPSVERNTAQDNSPTQTIRLVVGNRSVNVSSDNPDGLLDILAEAGLTTA